MADTPAQPATENLHEDPVTGERISKTELKRRQKQRDNEKKKAEKAEKAASSAVVSRPKQKSAQEEEADLNPNQYFEIRSRAIKKILDVDQSKAYPHKFHENTRVADFLAQYAHLKKGETLPEVEVRVRVRIMAQRASGSALRFYTCRAGLLKKGEENSVQVMCQQQEATDKDSFIETHDVFRRGDIVGIVGFPGRTSPKNRADGELSIFAREVILLTPCLHQLPSEHFGLKDQEQRHRNKPLDLIMNEGVAKTLFIRAAVIRGVRRYLEDLDFLEVETPMMDKLAGGATAKPFVTHHNELGMDLFLRVAPELHLKKLIVGGLDRVFEIGKNFRNEGIDLTHNPEFTSCEFYMAGADYLDVLGMTEDMVSGIVKTVTGGYVTKYHTQDGQEFEVNWEKPWRRVDMITELEKATDEKFPASAELHTDEANEFLKRVLKKVNVECSPPQTNARMIDKLVGEFIEENAVNPTFIVGHPEVMSPLAKYHRDRPGLTERFEAFVCKKEIANAYTELNNPFEQRIRFEEQMRQKAQGDDEAQPVDEGFLRALELGLPPTGGWGMGIDRLVMFLADHYSIKEVLAFPFMKDVVEEKKPFAAEVVDIEPKPVEGIPHK
ncbi:putative Lysyl-tRNA synthetase [Polyplosphaeria fusca]|uniref:Probable lysine--tRNA ligase, cytoplasmic n=1 Tax=Polyplosphaeria fusca TaxID=682080 RepID=A0A9P4QNY1_9PLEO|nr:putative Lysyl-tRNA synthetase [Polyplosphaeria fusca]